MEYSVENVCGLLIRSKLLAPDDVKAMYQRWQADAKDAVKNLTQFTRWLVTHQYVTEYQAGLVAKGHADVFFIKQYKILDRLGQGRMAGVYKAIHQLGQVVAIKILPPSKGKDPRILGRFQREVRLALKLKHPNVVRAFQVGEYNGLHYLVMEYLEGETLGEVLARRGKLPAQEAVRLIHQALVGLEHIHEQGLVHRDLKPANLMLVPAPTRGEPDTTARATLKILDIGLGRALFDDRAETLAEHLHLTGEGVLLGTPDYLAPEQARDPSGVDIRADIYSLGCVLYHALTGQTPFPDTNILSQMVRHATEMPRSVCELNPAVPNALEQILNWMLAKEPAQRYPTPERAAQALQVFLVAGQEPPRLAEEGPQLRKFLTWVEMNDPSGSKERAPKKSDPAVALPAPTKGDKRADPSAPAGGSRPTAVPIAAPVQESPSRQRSKKHRRRHGAGVAIAPTAPLPALARAEEFDVELVDIPQPRTTPTRPGRRLSNRDWLMLGIGAGCVIIAGVIGAVLGRMLDLVP
jgi:serine/threonine protein kinase